MIVDEIRIAGDRYIEFSTLVLSCPSCGQVARIGGSVLYEIAAFASPPPRAAAAWDSAFRMRRADSIGLLEDTE